MGMSVDQITAQIHKLVNEQGFLSTSRNDHLHQVNKLLQGLSAADADQVLSKLSGDDLKKWADEVNSSGIFGADGLSGGEKKDLFNLFARDLDGTQLARVSSSFGNRDDVICLGQSVAQYATPDTKAAYVKQLAGQTTDKPYDFQSGWNQTTFTGDQDAVAIGNVLASLKGNSQAFNDAVNSLNGTQLAAVVTAAEGQRSTHYLGQQGQPSVTTNAQPLADILSAAATSTDPAIKARVFEAGSKGIGQINDTNSILSPNLDAAADVKRVTQGLTDILNSDPTGVVRALKLDQPGGTSLTSYMKEVISQDPSAGNKTIGTLLARLQQGNDLKRNPLDFVNQASDDGHGGKVYVNAENLGYFSGAVQAGIGKITSDAKTEGDILNNILTTAVSVGTGWKVPTPVKIGATVVNAGIREGIREVVADVSSGNKSLADALFELAMPHDPNGKTAELGSDSSFLSYRSTVILQNQ
jgi:hypothetical protein